MEQLFPEPPKRFLLIMVPEINDPLIQLYFNLYKKRRFFLILAGSRNALPV